jgi:hypothetical protein
MCAVLTTWSIGIATTEFVSFKEVYRDSTGPSLRLAGPWSLKVGVNHRIKSNMVSKTSKIPSSCAKLSSPHAMHVRLKAVGALRTTSWMEPAFLNRTNRQQHTLVSSTAALGTKVDSKGKSDSVWSNRTWFDVGVFAAQPIQPPAQRRMPSAVL